MNETILIAEDSPTQSRRLSALLEEAGYSVEAASDGQAALEAVDHVQPDMIISDVVMPVLDGYELCRELKSKPNTRHIPFVLLTERRTPADIIRGFEVGADNFLTKPFSDESLVHRIGDIFRHLELRKGRTLEVEIRLTAGDRQITISADKQQMFELLLATSEELSQVNEALAESQRILQRHATTLEEQVSERTRELNESLEALARTMDERMTLFSKLLRAQEEERQRIARDVHDEPIQLMAAAGLRVGVLQKRVEDSETAVAMQRVYNAIERATASLRRAMFHLTPAALEREGLETAIAGYVSWIETEGGIACHIDYRLPRDPPNESAVVVYRIVQEALTNIRKHATASNVWLCIEEYDGGIQGTVRDDGQGFDTSKRIDARDHIGLDSMRERAELARGHWRIESSPGVGTTISFWIPGATTRTAKGSAQ